MQKIVREVGAALIAEAARREEGLVPDPAFDVPLAMLLDLADELKITDQEGGTA